MHYIDTLFAKLTQLEATPGKNDKLAILKTFTEHELNVAYLAVEPTVNFYIAAAPKVDPASNGKDDWDDRVDCLLESLSSRRVSGTAARDLVNLTLKELKPNHAEVFRRVLLKDLRCGVGTTLLNTVAPGLITDPPYMRCSLPDKSNLKKWSAEAWKSGVISQVKADGMFANLSIQDNGTLLVTSRQGSRFPADALEHLAESRARQTGVQFHGELLCYRDGKLLERQVGNGLLNSLLQDGTLPDNVEVQFHYWDMIPLAKAVAKGSYDEPYPLRLDLARSVAGDSRYLVPIETRVVHSYDEALAHYRDALARGLEGTIIKHPDTVWKDGTSKDQVKMKLEVDVDLKLVGFLDGTGKNEALFGSAVMQSACGSLEVSVSGFTDEVRKSIHERREELLTKGQVYTVRANALMKPSDSNPLHSLFLPRFVEERLDKSQADTLEMIQDQFEAAAA